MTLEPTDTPAGYNAWLTELNIRIREIRLRASLAVNAELIGLYWRIGRDILERQERDGWGVSLCRLKGSASISVQPRLIPSPMSQKLHPRVSWRNYLASGGRP